MSMNFWKKKDDAAEAAPPAGETAMDSMPPAETSEAPAPGTGLGAAERGQLEQRVIEAISTVYDPEIPVNIYELGLIYDIEVTPQSDVVIEMTLTSPACPVAGSLPGDVEAVVGTVGGVRAVDVHLVWDPPWTPDRMTEAAKLELGFM